MAINKNKSRVILTLYKDTCQLIDELAKAKGVSKSELIEDMLNTMYEEQLSAIYKANRTNK